jgi:hypothetical protein
VKLGTENRTKTIIAAALGLVTILVVVYELVPMFSGSSATQVAASQPVLTATPSRTGTRRGTAPGKKAPVQPNLDPALQLQLLAASEQTKYEGSGRNIFVSQAEDVVIPKPTANGTTDHPKDPVWTPPAIPASPPIPLKFFGFASQPGEPKKIFLSKGEDVFIAGEGEIIDRRYKVMRISASSVEVQDLVSSGPPQNIPLTQG